MTREELIRNLKYTMKKHENDKVPTFGTNISIMCKDILDYLEQEPCEDAISRKKVLNTLFYNSDNNCEVVLNKELQDRIKSLPPVKPTRKKGKWIDIMVGDMPAQACDQCNTFYPLAYTGGGHRYCPNCGAEMESKDNGKMS